MLISEISVSLNFIKGVDEQFIDMVENHGVYNRNVYNFFGTTFKVKYAGNPTPTLEWHDESGEIIISETYDPTFTDRYSMTLVVEMQNMTKPEIFTLIARNKKNITMIKEFYMISEGISIILHGKYDLNTTIE